MFTCVEKTQKFPEKEKTSGLINLVSNLKEKYCALVNCLRNFPLIPLCEVHFW